MPQEKHPKLSKKFACFDVSEVALSVINDELTEAERNTVFWRAESLANHLYKDFQRKWEDPAGTTGSWYLPTVDKDIVVHWRFDGVENALPVFYLGDISWDPKEEEEVLEEDSTGFAKVRRLLLLLLAMVAVLTIAIEELGMFTNTVTHLFEIVTAVVTSVMALKE